MQIKHSQSSVWRAFALGGLLVVCLGGCGGPLGSASRHAASTANAASTAQSESADRAGGAANSAEGQGASNQGASMSDGSGHLLGDEDDDDTRASVEGDGHLDSDSDSDNDRAESARLGYNDSDDGPALSYGHPASAAERETIESMIKRYYAAAVAADGRRGCALMYSLLEESIQQDFGEAPGPGYMHGAKGCPAVLSLLFAHNRKRFAGGAKVTGVRVLVNKGHVFIGSSEAPAGILEVKRERGVWKIDSVFAGALP